MRRCVWCHAYYQFPAEGGYKRCQDCRNFHVTNRQLPKAEYESRQCINCQRDYLYPHYGGYKRCNDCAWTEGWRR
jgi:hypothetical protein